MSALVEPSQRDVVFTPFMLRVRAAVQGADGTTTQLRLAPSRRKGVAAATDDWMFLRARSEQVTAEANAMLDRHTRRIDLVDEVGTGRLAFVMSCGAGAARISMAQAGRQAWVKLDGFNTPGRAGVAPADPETLEDLAIVLLTIGGQAGNG